jgi:PAS domain S-box-containing protein
MYPVEIYLQLFERETGSYYISIAQDISSQTAAESKLKSIVETADAIIWAADVDSKLEFLSDQVRDILGYNAEQFIGTSLVDMIDAGYFHWSDKDRLVEGFKQVLKGGNRISDLRCRAKQTDGTWRWFSVNMTPNVSVNGEVGQIVGVMHDIHAQKLAEEALLQLNQELDSRVREEIQRNKEKDLLLQRQSRLAAMGEMIGNIAHQWRQPINSLGLILGDLEDAALYGECDLSYIQTAVGKSKYIIQKMSSTIDDFRNFFRADKSPGTFSLRHVTDECLNLVEAAMKSHSINIVVECEHDVVVRGYANEYSQAVMNILSNAREAIIERRVTDGRIVIRIGEDGEFGIHTVTDNGGGIPPEVLPKIFEPHFTTKEQGVGIGLYMTLISIEKNMHGKIDVENVAEGASFSIRLPKS